MRCTLHVCIELFSKGPCRRQAWNYQMLGFRENCWDFTMKCSFLKNYKTRPYNLLLFSHCSFFCKNNWILLKTWAYLFVQAKIFSKVISNCSILQRNCKKVWQLRHHLTLKCLAPNAVSRHFCINTTTSTIQIVFSLKYVFRVPITSAEHH